MSAPLPKKRGTLRSGLQSPPGSRASVIDKRLARYLGRSIAGRGTIFLPARPPNCSLAAGGQQVARAAGNEVVSVPRVSKRQSPTFLYKPKLANSDNDRFGG